MFINIDKSVAANLSNAEIKATLLVGLENLATGRREGKHLLFSDRETLSQLATCSELSSAARQVYRKTYERAAELGGERNFFRFQATVMALDQGIYQEPDGELVKIFIPISFFQDSFSIQPTFLLAENMIDAEVYKIIGSVWIAINKKLNLKIICESKPGGGSTLINVFQDIIQGSKRFCLSILDSDKRSPGSKLGDTAAPFVRLDNTPAYAKVVIIESRELENLIPTALMSAVSERDKSRMEAINFLEILEATPHSSCRKFLDLKEGSSLKSLLTHDDPTRSFWESVLPNIKHLYNVKPSCLVEVCKKCEHCDSIIAPGLGKHILNNVLEDVRSRSNHQLAHSLCNLTKPEWEELGTAISSFCCGTSPIYT
jgi:hypothetical protein